MSLVLAMAANKNVKHRYMPTAFRWTRSCVARRLHWRSSALRADERARVVPNIGFSALRAVEPSLERHPFGATSSSRTRAR